MLVTEDNAFSLLGTAFDTNFADVDLNTFAGIEIVTQPSVGGLTFDGATFNDGEQISLADLNLNKLVYTPQTDDETGSSFTFKVMDDTGAYSDLAYTLTLDISATSDNPTAANESVLVTGRHDFTLLGSAFDTNFA